MALREARSATSVLYAEQLRNIHVAFRALTSCSQPRTRDATSACTRLNRRAAKQATYHGARLRTDACAYPFRYAPGHRPRSGSEARGYVAVRGVASVLHASLPDIPVVVTSMLHASLPDIPVVVTSVFATPHERCDILSPCGALRGHPCPPLAI